ncbi:MAG: hypothetical protein J1F63_04195 [Oscillospiraceae bacterium]|nr:hypothetical protein [Oscillospiraceae bacterium]
MKKALKIIGIILLIIVVIIAGLAAWQWKYVSAVIDGLRLDDAQLGERQVQHAQKAIADINSQVSVELRDMTEEEEQLVASGELSQAEVMARIFAEAMGTELPSLEDLATEPGGNAEVAPAVEPDEEGGEVAGQTPEESTHAAGSDGINESPRPAALSSDQYVAAAVSKLYALQAKFTGSIDEAISSAHALYRDQKAATGSEMKARTSAINKLTGDINSLEASCDAQVEAVLGELTNQLNSIGSNTSVVSTIRGTYEKEKEDRRAGYIQKFSKYM